MPRLLRLSAMGPIKIDPKTLDPEKPIWICACGLSQTFPFCDGAHKACRVTEHEGMLHVYSEDRRVIIESTPIQAPLADAQAFDAPVKPDGGSGERGIAEPGQQAGPRPA